VKTTLLLADNSVTIQRVIELTFADEDTQVIAVSDGDAAIARIEEEPPDIVLADAGMPGKSGYDVARYIKQSPRLAHIPVLLLTGAFEPLDEDKAREAGCDGVLAKPFEPHLVIGRVKDLLARSRDAAGPGGSVAPAGPAGTNHEAAPPADAGDFFERLDAAFATRTAAHPGTHLSLFARAGDTGEPPVLRAVPRSSPAWATPTLGDTFAALLAAEQVGTSPAAAAWPSSDPAVTDELVERVTGRVLERLTDHVVRETVAALASTIAERLIREEIDRIKAAIT
jgi:CheY-like chemotaxis protein